MKSSDDLFECIETVLSSDLRKGDQIATRGRLADLSPLLRKFEFSDGQKHYLHHGIYIGNNEVIDFGGQDKGSAKPRKVDLLEFMESSCDRKLYRVRYKPGVCLPVDETIKMAEEMVANRSRWPMYDILKNNCETFATYLKTKVKASSQAAKALWTIFRNPVKFVGTTSATMYEGGSGGSGPGSGSGRSGP